MIWLSIATFYKDKFKTTQQHLQTKIVYLKNHIKMTTEFYNLKNKTE